MTYVIPIYSICTFLLLSCRALMCSLCTQHNCQLKAPLRWITSACGLIALLSSHTWIDSITVLSLPSHLVPVIAVRYFEFVSALFTTTCVFCNDTEDTAGHTEDHSIVVKFSWCMSLNPLGKITHAVSVPEPWSAFYPVQESAGASSNAVAVRFTASILTLFDTLFQPPRSCVKSSQHRSIHQKWRSWCKSRSITCLLFPAALALILLRTEVPWYYCGNVSRLSSIVTLNLETSKCTAAEMDWVAIFNVSQIELHTPSACRKYI